MARATDWLDTIFNVNLANGSQNIEDLTQESIRNDMIGYTILRWIVHITTFPATPGVEVGEQQLSYAIGMVERDAKVASAVPDANIDTEYPGRGWLLRDVAMVHNNTSGALPVYPPYEARFDIRAKRKFENTVPVMIANNTNLQGTTFGVRYVGVVRLLLLTR